MSIVTGTGRDRIAGRYRLLELVGQGGMGRVWRGWDEILERDVAVKEVLFPPGLDDVQREALLKRVMREARAAARLNHPGIITIHDVVEHDGAPVIVMEYVAGRSLAAEIRENGWLSVPRVAEIGAAVLDALVAAHVAGVVHRDVKPDNILLAGRRVVLTDFGIAGVADRTTALTDTGMVMGTPTYLAPEQLDGKPATSASDLWSLGATLYTAAEGEPPFAADTLTALYVAILTRAPRPARRADALAPVVAELLVKDPELRATAGATALALAALPAATPTESAPAEPALSSEASVHQLPTVTAPVARSPEAPHIPTERQMAPTGPESSDLANPSEKDSPGELPTESAHKPLSRRRLLLTGSGVVAAGAVSALIALSDRSVDSPSGGTSTSGSPSVDAQSPSMSRIATTSGVNAVAFSPDGKILAGACDDETVRLWDVATHRVTATLIGHRGRVFTLTFSPDGKTLASGCDDGAGRVRVWDMGTKRAIATVRAHDNANSLSFSPDGRTLAGATDNGVLLWDLATGKETPLPHLGGSQSAVFSPDGDVLAFGLGKDVKVWNMATGRTAATFSGDGRASGVQALAFSPDGRILASGSDETVRLWNVVAGLSTATLTGHTDEVQVVAFSPDGQTLASGSNDRTVRLWDVTTGRIVAPLHADDRVFSLTFSPDGNSLAVSGGGAVQIQLWRLG
ncbi:WD40 repeat domain-containing serine/threonine protein kinase [Streptomyces lydicus]|uniref:WD40 repeat domain-containing serine/threonine protein kinase n=1 Tax=Streptomyces lydicus TaxID=47763 RepID=UPI00381F6566